MMHKTNASNQMKHTIQPTNLISNLAYCLESEHINFSLRRNLKVKVIALLCKSILIIICIRLLKFFNFVKSQKFLRRKL